MDRPVLIPPSSVLHRVVILSKNEPSSWTDLWIGHYLSLVRGYNIERSKMTDVRIHKTDRSWWMVNVWSCSICFECMLTFILVIRSYCQVSILFGPQRTVNLVQLPGVQFVIGISPARTRIMVKMRSEPEVNILKFSRFWEWSISRSNLQTHTHIY